MAAGYLSPIGLILQVFTDQGVVGAGYKIYTYVAGSTTPAPTFTDSTLTVLNSNPIIMQSNGRLPFSVWVATGQLTKMVITDPNGVVIAGGTVDNLPGLNDPGALNAYPQTAAEAFATITPSNTLYAPASAFRYGADPTGTTDTTTALQTWINASWAGLLYGSPWPGAGGANLVPTLPPGRYQVSNYLLVPCNVTVTGTAHPANTESHTRIIQNSTGITPARVWSANTVIPNSGRVQAVPNNGYWYSANATFPAGTTGATQPTWPITIGATVVDGTVTWTCAALNTPGDNRNIPIMKFSRAVSPSTYPNGGVLADSGLNTTLQNLEFWCVTPGGTFNAPFAASNQIGDYPLGGALYFDVTTIDTRIVSCVFQNLPCAIRINNVPAASQLQGDGFTTGGVVNLWVEECEFDASGAHIWATNVACDLVFKNTAFYGGVHKYDNCTGRVVYDNCRFYGGAYIDASNSLNNFNLFSIDGGEWDLSAQFDSISIYRALMTNVKNIAFAGSSGKNGIVINYASSGVIAGNNINDSGFNATPSVIAPWVATTAYATNSYVLPTANNSYYYSANPGGTSGSTQPTWPLTVGASVTDGSVTWTNAGLTSSLLVAAIKAIDCFNLMISGNNITTTDASAYNGFGILSMISVRGSVNFVNANSVNGSYNGSSYLGQQRYIALSGSDIRGLNYEARAGGPGNKIGPFAGQRVAVVPVGTTYTPDCSQGNEFDIQPTAAGTAVNIPNPINGLDSQEILVFVRNATGGSLGTITFGPNYKLLTFTPPNNGATCAIRFRYDSTNWVQTQPQTLQVPN